MPAISNPDTPPSSPPRKKLKFSLKLKNRTKKLREGKGTTQDKAKLYPIFSRTPSKKQPISVGTETSTDNTEFGQPPPPYTGLKNLGNTCYLNVILQVLRYSPEFTHAVEQLDHDLQTNQESGEENEDTSEMVEQKAQEESRNYVVKALHELFVKMSSVEEEYAETGNFTEGGELAVEPDDFINIFSELNPMYSGHFQHDAQEFLSSLLMNIQESMDSLKPRQQTQNLKIDSCSSPATSLKSSPFLSDAVRMKGGRKLDLATETNQSNNCMSPSKKHGSSTFISQNCASPATPKKLPTCNVASDLLKCKTSQQDTVDLISSLFQGRLTLQTKCLDCEKSHERFEDFQDVSIPVQKQSVDYTDKKQACLSPDHDMDKPVDLAWGLSQFASVERLTGEDKYFCDDCSRLTEAEINTKFQALPQILTIHLKRFTATSFGLSQGWVSKITSTLETPTDISLEQWCTRTCKYRQEHFELFGIVMHSGMSSCAGHYFAYCKVPAIKPEEESGEHLAENEEHDTKKAQDVLDHADCKTTASNTSSRHDLTNNNMEVDQSLEKKTSSSCIPGWKFGKLFKQNHKTQKNDDASSNEGSESLTAKRKLSFDDSEERESVKRIRSFQYRGTFKQQQKTNCCSSNETLVDSVQRKDLLDNSKLLETGSKHSNNDNTDAEQGCSPVWIKRNDCNPVGTTISDNGTRGRTTSSYENVWVKFDDGDVQLISPEEMNNITSHSVNSYSTPYLLFYRRKVT